MIQQTEQQAARTQVPGAANNQKTSEKVPTPNQEQKSATSPDVRRLAAGDWLRAVAGFSAPFGHDGMPTVWG